MSNKGYVYVLTNPSFKEDWVKIGKSKRLPDVRSRELFNTAVPLPFEIYAILKTEKYNEAERMIHRSIDRLSDRRIHNKREFFNIRPEDTYEILLDIKNLLGDEAGLELMGDNVESENNTLRKKTSEVFSFYTRGMKDGDVIVFADDENIKAIVAGARQVIFEGELFYLSPLTRKIYSEKGCVNESGAYQGPKYFTYNNVRLTELPVVENRIMF